MIQVQALGTHTPAKQFSELANISCSAQDPKWHVSALHKACHEGKILLIARLESRAVGYLVATTVVDEAEIYTILVDQSFRHRGLGKALVGALLDLLEPQAVSCFLEVRASNLAAQALYSHFGFQQTTIRKAYYKTLDGLKEDAVMMAKYW